jgi:thymidylate synthase (FAD)
MAFVTPQTYLVGFTNIDYSGLSQYLIDTNQTEFVEFIEQAQKEGVSPGEILCSFYAKLCYKSLTTGKNANISKVRGIQDNIQSTIKSGHGSVFEHCWLNFVTTNCSRVFTHELVRHRVGTAFSQTSGRYVALGVDSEENPSDIDLVLDPLLSEHSNEIDQFLLDYIGEFVRDLRKKLKVKDLSFDQKKKLTSAIRRLAPNGQANEIGWSCNIRSLRHMIEMRTARFAEWEIRTIFNQVADIILDRWPGILYGHSVQEIDGLNEYTNLRI